ncbi:TonB-dependent receptor [Bacteroides uniformis]|uniref:SusC/RagA family TonB-linked outer membrane protein n=1 Tax=Bacteroides uniformis TaxID=820 RepID=UPI00125DFF4A|nr:TonB-dependent receptor [Bacteroides uniformis]KAB4166859.1 TonB-dependent receptor [Bacteroides uniformis]KAB4176541.1 TonB-dependent receptor [Bacteroides uniformis]
MSKSNYYKERVIQLLLFFAFMLPMGALAQNIQLNGTVTDVSGESVIGASVLEKGTTNGVITDIDGNFTLSVSPKATIIISYVGYAPQEIALNGRKELKVVLKEDTELLDEVVVIGYGTQKKSDVSGSVSSVSGDKLNNIPTANAETALQGMAPGLIVNFGSGAAGSTPSLQVRGVTTYGTDNSPLVIIDGVPGDMSFLNPEDIKSMSVLKDAATAAIYGARAAAGVILIETYRGTKSKPKITFSAYWGVDQIAKKLDVCNAEEFIHMAKMARTNAGQNPKNWPAYIAAYEQDPTQFGDTDWQDEYYRNGFTQKYNVGYTSGSENANVALSVFYSKNEAIVTGTGDEKYGFRLNSDMKRGKFKVGESVNYSRWESEMEANSGFPGIYQVTNMEPIARLYDENCDGGYGGAIPGMNMSDAANMVGYNNLIENTRATDYIKGSGYLQYEPIKGLVIKAQASRSLLFRETRVFKPTYELGAMKWNESASLSQTRTRSVNDLLELTANYKFTIKDSHDFAFLLGASQEESTYDLLGASGSEFENNDMGILGQARKDYGVQGEKTRSGLRSVFGRVNYSWKMRYMLMASFRYDGSSRFADGNQWGFFPSVSVGWNIANEPFWEDMKETVSSFKLRMSYGALGNQSVPLYLYIPKLDSNADNINYPFDGKVVNQGYAVRSLPSRNIKWETTFYKNIGVDMSLWNNKLEFSIEGYIKDTKDMLSEKNISLSTGYGALTVNDGELRTTGMEMQLIYHGNAGKDFKYDLDFNLSHFKSKLKSMADPNYMYEYGASRTYVGGYFGEFWAYETAGIIQNEAEAKLWKESHGRKDSKGNWIPMQPNAEPGDLRFVDQNGDGMLDSDDKKLLGNGCPKASIGFNVTLNYKNFDLVANFYGDLGVDRYNYTKYQLERMDTKFNYGRNALKAWTPENPNTNIPRAVYGDPNKNARTSDRFIERGDFFRLNNLQLGYNLPATVCGKLGISNLRFYVGGTRIFTITGYSGYDPSTNGGIDRMGYDYASSPLCRTFMAGIKFGF